jgi:phosphinothricin acetyltransferase
VEDSVYVHPDFQGRGVGKGLLTELVTLAGHHGFHAVIGRIVGGHEASIGLHRACGFEQVGVEREVGRKFGRWLDVVLMQRLLSGPPGPPPRS